MAGLTILGILLTSASFGKQSNKTNQIADKEINTKKSTFVSSCTKKTDTFTLATILSAETKSEADCNALGKSRTESMAAAGFTCSSKDKKSKFECNVYSYISYSINFKEGVAYDNLMYTDLNGNSSSVVYLNRGSGPICETDRKSMIAAGVKDAVCKKRDDNAPKAK